MADEREETSRLYGPPRITVVPHEGQEDGPPLLHTSRVPGQGETATRAQFPRY
ncbi:hypothetical protein LZ30DRAFT_595654 [Colletotrichum cereale]|nr:hypothetical protein LZ30DRAFT_595654 [Colletotrichum cereale]